jgi:hypothetical protein
VDGVNDVMNWQSMGQNTIGTVLLSSLNITLDAMNQTLYRSSIRACNSRHCSSVIYSDGFIRTNVAPEFLVIDSASDTHIISSIIPSISTSPFDSFPVGSVLSIHDIDYQVPLDTLTLIWMSTQPSMIGLPVVSTEIAIGTCTNDTSPLVSSAYMTSIVGWTSVPTNESSINGLYFGSYTAHSLALSLGVTYCSYIRLTDTASSSGIFSSNGIRTWNQPPLGGMVYDVSSSHSIIDIDVSTSYSTSFVYWSGFYGDGIPLTYNITLVAIGTSMSMESLAINGGSYESTNVNDYNIVSITISGATRSLNSSSDRATISPLSLVPLQLYRWIICAINPIGLSACSMSDGFIVDVTPPLEGDVIIGNRSTSLMAQYVACCVMVHWNGFVDLESGMTVCISVIRKAFARPHIIFSVC